MAKHLFGFRDQKVAGSNPVTSTRKSRKPKGFRFFFFSFAQSAVFGAFFMQRMCSLGKRAKDMLPYRAEDLANSWSTGPKGRRRLFLKKT